MSSRELQPYYDPSDDPFYGLGYTPDEQAVKLHTDHEQQQRQIHDTPVRPFKRSGNVRSTESDRDMIREQQPTDGELPDRVRGFTKIDEHTRERIDLLEASYEAIHPDDSMGAARVVAAIARQQQRRKEYGLAEHSSLTIDD
ncbi:hypothetical protein HY312_04760 [Candidatus Saccharibacteria bacterium]|nr:hypothetical protein [Candidatus Saccharibacteria bacterium]